MDALKNMLVFRRVNCSDMRYYIKQLLFKSSKGKGARSPRGEERGCGSPQNVSTTEGLRKDRKRKLDAVIVEDDTRPTVSSFLLSNSFKIKGSILNGLVIDCTTFYVFYMYTHKSDNGY